MSIMLMLAMQQQAPLARMFKRVKAPRTAAFHEAESTALKAEVQLSGSQKPLDVNFVQSALELAMLISNQWFLHYFSACRFYKRRKWFPIKAEQAQLAHNNHAGPEIICSGAGNANKERIQIVEQTTLVSVCSLCCTYVLLQDLPSPPLFRPADNRLPRMLHGLQKRACPACF
jgi:hypothetical protein